MSYRQDPMTADDAWIELYTGILEFGHYCAPRGQTIKELPHQTIVVDMQYPVVTNKLRRLNYRFMATEALWILSARDDLAMLSAVNPIMEKFSDDGKVLAGAYGPRIMSQVLYVVDKLIEDRDTRQATLTIWQPNPRSSKDIPCTISMDFKIRNNLLHCHVFMRSSDVWLGLPYDIFAFSTVAQYIACVFNNAPNRPKNITLVCLGNLYLTAASSHVYDRDIIEPASLIHPVRCERNPAWELGKPSEMLSDIRTLSASKRGDPSRWWERVENKHITEEPNDE